MGDKSFPVLLAFSLLMCFSDGILASPRKQKPFGNTLEVEYWRLSGDHPVDWQNKEIARVLRNNPKTKRFHFSWHIIVGTYQTECEVYYNRSKRMLSFYVFGAASSEGPMISGVATKRMVTIFPGSMSFGNSDVTEKN